MVARADGKIRMTALLETIGVRKAFGAVIAAGDISIAVERGQKLGLIGNNGAGKTTFINIVTGHLKPDAGRVMLDGKDITGLGPRQVRRDGVSRSFQIPQLFTSLTLDQNLLLAFAILRDKGMSSWQPARSDAELAELDDLLGRFRLREYREQTIAVLPGGVRKLVDVAMAVTCRPKLLLLDEPTSGVAVEEKFPLMDVIMHAIEGSETTVLFVEHDMDIVGRYADRVLAFYAGRVIADGEPGAVLKNEEVQRYVTGGAA
jgi:branched-chain amino acid transport system ATP-binding protein